MMTREEVKVIAEVDTHSVIRDRMKDRMSPENYKIYLEYFTVEKLQDVDNWSDDDVDLYLSLTD